METCMAVVAMLAGFPAVAAAVVMVLTFGFLLLAPRPARADEKAKEPATVTTNALTRLNRSDVERALQKLAETPAPKNLSRGALCYDSARKLYRSEYVCPKCGAKTLYAEDSPISVYQLPACRRLLTEVQKVSGRNLSLDESQFCRTCAPDVKAPQIILNVDYDDGKRLSVAAISTDDLTLLKEFFSGQLKHDEGISAAEQRRTVCPTYRAEPAHHEAASEPAVQHHLVHRFGWRLLLPRPAIDPAEAIREGSLARHERNLRCRRPSDKLDLWPASVLDSRPLPV